MTTQSIVASVLVLFTTTAFAADQTPVQKYAVPQPMPIAMAPAVTSSSTENWKGAPEQDRFTLGAVTGLGIINATPGLALVGAAAAKILDHGFIPDINNSVWVEAEMGPVFAKGHAGFTFSGHMRWNFVLNDDWIFYALAGLGGAKTGSSLGDKLEFYPRLGAGAVWRMFAAFDIRAEVSHELIVLGPEFEF